MSRPVIAVNVGPGPRAVRLRDDLARVFEEGKNLFFEDSHDWWLSVATNAVVLYSGERVIDTDRPLFFIRARRKESALVALVCTILAQKGTPFTDIANQYHSDHADKSFAIPRLALHGLPVPRTIVASYQSFQRNIEHIERTISYPAVIKGDGARGEAVYLVHDRTETEVALEKVRLQGQSLITFQEVVSNTYDVRALFFKDRCLAVMRRTRSNDAAFLNNVSAGGNAAPDELTSDELALCRRAMATSDIDLCGIDFIRTPSGIVFLEMNKSPQLNAIRDLNPDLSIGQVLHDLSQSL